MIASTKSYGLHYNMIGAGLPVDFGSEGETAFRKSTNGEGTVQKTAQGLELGVTATAAAQYAELNQGDVLGLDIDELIRIEFDYRVDSVAGDTTGIEFLIGLASARNATADTIAESVWLRIIDETLFLESDDASTDNDEYDTGYTLNRGIWQRAAIDLKTGVKTQSPPFQSVGGKANIMFFTSGNGLRNRNLEQIHLDQGFDMSNYSGGLQLFARCEKYNTASTNDAQLSIRNICVEMRNND